MVLGTISFVLFVLQDQAVIDKSDLVLSNTFNVRSFGKLAKCDEVSIAARERYGGRDKTQYVLQAKLLYVITCRAQTNMSGAKKGNDIRTSVG